MTAAARDPLRPAVFGRFQLAGYGAQPTGPQGFFVVAEDGAIAESDEDGALATYEAEGE
jgi:hypothetical protein